MAETHFDEWMAERLEILWPELFDPAFLDSSVDFLADLAGTGPALELGIAGFDVREFADDGLLVH